VISKDELNQSHVDELPKEALRQWYALTGVDPSTSSFTFGSLSIREMNEELDESLKLDPSGTSMLLLLECFLREYLSSKKFTASEIIKDYKALTDYLDKAQKLFETVQSDEVTEAAVAFRATVIASLKYYGADRPEVLKVVNDPDVLPFLRRDALRSMKMLKPYQFLSGDRSEGKPQFIGKIYQAWDINHLLVAVRDMGISGVAMVLMRDPSHTDRSYFAFAMKNGDNVMIFTDKTKWATPAQADLMRRPDKAFVARAWENHFPYQLTNFKIEDKSLQFDKVTGLVAHGVNMVPIGNIHELHPEQIVWTVMMLSLIADKFWTNKWQAKELSYTAGMIKVRQQLVVDSTGALLPIASGYKEISIDRIKPEDVVGNKLLDQTVFETRCNEWIEQRYAHLVTEEVINQWTPTDGKTLQLSHGSEDKVELGGNVVRFSGDPVVYKLRGMSPSEFGTEAELKADQIWLARHNMARQLQKAADAEYKERKAEIMAWYRDAVTQNLPTLLKAIANGSMTEPYTGFGFGNHNKQTQNKMMHFDEIDSDYWRCKLSDGVNLGSFDKKAGKHGRRCIITEAAASYRAFFSPYTAYGISLLAGCEVSDLPDILKHWRHEKPYTGNNILSRLDPVETDVYDPWMNFVFRVNVWLSRRGYTSIKKDYALQESQSL
jgi:hypothetical protein